MRKPDRAEMRMIKWMSPRERRDKGRAKAEDGRGDVMSRGRLQMVGYGTDTARANDWVK